MCPWKRVKSSLAARLKCEIPIRQERRNGGDNLYESVAPVNDRTMLCLAKEREGFLVAVENSVKKYEIHVSGPNEVVKKTRFPRTPFLLQVFRESDFKNLSLMRKVCRNSASFCA